MLLSDYEERRIVFEYLLKITDLRKKYKNQKNLLHLAVENFAPLKTLKAILKNNPSLIHELDSKGFSCLDYAYMKQAYDDEAKIIKFLIDKGCKPNVINSKLLIKISEFYKKLKEIYRKYKVDQTLVNESVAEIINMHQTMKMKNNIPDNIPDCLMQEMIILIMYTRIEDIKSKLGIDVSDNYVPFITEEVTNLINIIKVRKLREAQGLKQVPLSLHLVFSGNPGTGKTTVARILAKIYKEIGVLSKGQLIETDRSGLVAGYVGQTAI